MSLRGFFGRIVGRLEVLGLPLPYEPYRAWVEPDVLMRGTKLTDRERAELLSIGIRSIVNLCAENDDDQAWRARQGDSCPMRVERYPVVDFDVPTPQQRDAFLAWVEDPRNQPCYVHCRGGHGRTGVVVACYRISRGWGLEAALQEAAEFGMDQPEQIEAVKEFARTSGRRPGTP